MLLWPFNPPKQFCIPPRCNKLNDSDGDDTNIIDIITLPHSNIVVILTFTRILIYNLKPMTLVAVQERTKESIDEFGSNVSLKKSGSFQYQDNNVPLDTEEVNSMLAQGKVMFYVITRKNFLLTFQIIKNSTPRTVFREYGLPVVDYSIGDENVTDEYDYNLDDDTLTVFDKQRASKVIQNGLIANKEKSFLQVLMNNNENVDELPIKRVELRLKIVLKFDFDIIDILGFKRVTNPVEGKYEEKLLILHRDGLQLLTLLDFKLVNSTLIKFNDGFKICPLEEKIIVVSYNNELQQTSINKIDIVNLSTSSLILNGDSSIITSFPSNLGIILVYENEVVFFDAYANKVTFQFKVHFSIKICKHINGDTFIFISTQNIIYFYTKFGNCLFATDFDKDDHASFPLFDYSAYTYFYDTLITATSHGQYHVWQLWLEAKQKHFDFRTIKSFILHKDNDMMIYSPQGDSPTSHDTPTIIKLPTKSLNNYISQVSVSGNLKLLTTFIANKNLLLIHNLETNIWFNYPDIVITDIQWLANNYLILEIKNYDGSKKLQCIHIPLQGTGNSDLSDLIIWEYIFPSSVLSHTIHVNTLSKYKSLKIKSKEITLTNVQVEKYYKTGEIVIITDSDIIIFDVISNISSNGVNMLKRILEYTRVKIPDNNHMKKIEWATTVRDGILLYADNTIFKMSKLPNGSWQNTELLCNIERIIDVLRGKIFLIQSSQYIVYDLDDLWDDKKEILTSRLGDDEGYPVSVSPDSAILHTLDCLFNKDFSKIIIKHDIYLDKLILAKLEAGVSLEVISTQFHSLKHYKFALEKILSYQILQDKDLSQILQLVKSCSTSIEESRKHPYSDMLEIISNCLRKIEIQHWKKLFYGLKMTPRDLLGLCIEGNEAKVLGALLLVFLNYNEADLVEDLKKEVKAENKKILEDIREHDESESNNDVGVDDGESTIQNTDTSVHHALNDEELMLRVLNVLVTSAATTEEPNRASDAWDMCFQLIRFLKELDHQNNTQMFEKAIEML